MNAFRFNQPGADSRVKGSWNHSYSSPSGLCFVMLESLETSQTPNGRVAGLVSVAGFPRPLRRLMALSRLLSACPVCLKYPCRFSMGQEVHTSPQGLATHGI
jgi:hypothetical protein